MQDAGRAPPRRQPHSVCATEVSKAYPRTSRAEVEAASCRFLGAAGSRIYTFSDRRLSLSSLHALPTLASSCGFSCLLSRRQRAAPRSRPWRQGSGDRLSIRPKAGCYSLSLPDRARQSALVRARLRGQRAPRHTCPESPLSQQLILSKTRMKSNRQSAQKAGHSAAGRNSNPACQTEVFGPAELRAYPRTSRAEVRAASCRFLDAAGSRICAFWDRL